MSRNGILNVALKAEGLVGIAKHHIIVFRRNWEIPWDAATSLVAFPEHAVKEAALAGIVLRR